MLLEPKISEAIQLPYYAQLDKVRSVMEESVRGFPCACEVASYAVAKVTDGKLQQIAGSFKSPFVKQPIEPHCWNYDSERNLWVDITLDQYDRSLDRIVVFPADTNRLKPDNVRTIALIERDMSGWQWLLNIVSK